MRLLLVTALVILLNACGSGGGADRIVLGRTNEIIVPTSLQYQDQFVVQVTDVDGLPIPSAIVTITLNNMQYRKGTFVLSDTDGDGQVDSWVANASATCTAEDTNNNAVLDPGEDINGNGTLEPTNPATVDAHPSLSPTFDPGTNQIITDDQGFGYFVITYPKSEAPWVRVRITATTSVSGTEDAATFNEVLPVLLDDVLNTDVAPPGTPSPYGTSANCTDAL